MNEELRKRLKEAAIQIYPISEIYNDLAMEFVDTNSGLREAFKDGGEVGIEVGYKEAIALAKEWLKDLCERVGFTGMTINQTADTFEADMNKLWEGEK